ncbi:MAG: cytochrome c biogenesis CcdA family protein [Rubrobacteraceae bacterium]
MPEGVTLVARQELRGKPRAEAPERRENRGRSLDLVSGFFNSVTDLQILVSGWLSALVAVLPVGFAFGAGMVSTANPCGIALLPSYMSTYLGGREDDLAKRSVPARLSRAVLVGTTVSLGFVLFFGLAGIVVSAGGTAVLGFMPALGFFIGGAMIVMGVLMLAGWSVFPRIGIFKRFANRMDGTREPSVRGYFVFGLVYGAGSLSCILPLFLAVVGTGVAAGDFATSAGQFLSYSLGMISVILTLTLALTFFKQGVLVRLKKVAPYMHAVSAVFLMLGGAYMIFYWVSRLNGTVLIG